VSPARVRSSALAASSLERRPTEGALFKQSAKKVLLKAGTTDRMIEALLNVNFAARGGAIVYACGQQRGGQGYAA
jgi:hypothetical protein